MRNRNVGYLISGIALLIIAIIFLFNSALRDIVADTCTHGPSCTMYSTISLQTYLSLAIAGFVLLIGLFMIFSKENERVVFQRVREKVRKNRIDLEGLDDTEKRVISILQREGGAFFQSSLMEELEIGKVKMTRIADKLEAKQLIERKRRGMNNILVLKNN